MTSNAHTDGLPPELAALAAEGVRVIPIADAPGVVLRIQNYVAPDGTPLDPVTLQPLAGSPSPTPEEGA